MDFAWMLLILATVPAAAAWRIRCIQKPATRTWWTVHLPVLVALVAIGLTAAAPFLTTRASGTGEAYNYSLSLADAIAQLRSGHLPLAGETAYAFNGRIHPLRNAPYLFYLGAGLDLVSCHQLTAWEIQNLAICLSLLLTAFSAYFALRRATSCSRVAAVVLTAIFTLSPAVLCILDSLDMFMTVHALPFAVGAVGAALLFYREWRASHAVYLGLCLGGAWLAHPPLALWLSQCVAILLLVGLCVAFSWRRLILLVGSAAVAGAFSAFVFASVHSLTDGLLLFAFGSLEHQNFADAVVQSGRSALAQWFLPVRLSRLDGLGSLQIGYSACALFALAWVAAVQLRRRKFSRADLAALAAIAVSVLWLLAVTLPVPRLTRALWTHLPTQFCILTNVWPMQRTFPIATLLMVFAGGFWWARASWSPRLKAGIATVLLGWTLFQSYPFFEYARRAVRSPEDTVKNHLDSNLNLTITAYAFIGVPHAFVHGVMDPEMELRFLHGGAVPRISNYDEALAHSRVVTAGTLELVPGKYPDHLVFTPKLHLDFGKKYLLQLDFTTAPQPATLILEGSALYREYILPNAGSTDGFGEEPGNRHALPLWTSLPGGESMQIAVQLPDAGARAKEWSRPANFQWREVDRDSLPIKLLSLSPLRLEVNAPDRDEWVETFRQSLAGYQVRVNGRDVRPGKSANQCVTFPVPKGKSAVEIRYVGPPYLYHAAWLSGLTAVALLLWAIEQGFGFHPLRIFGRAVARQWRTADAGSRAVVVRLFASAAIVALILGAIAIIRALHPRTPDMAVGPIRIRFLLNPTEVGRSEALLSTGVVGRGVVAYLVYPDLNHIKVGFDVWGSSFVSAPLEITQGQVQELVVDFGALYPKDDPRIKNLSGYEQRELRRYVRAELNGETVIAAEKDAFESTLEQISIGRSAIGGSLAQPDFKGEILSADRVPYYVSQPLIDAAPIDVSFDAATLEYDRRQPLLSYEVGGKSCVLYVTKNVGRELVFGFANTDGVVHETEPISGRAMTHVRVRLGRDKTSGSPMVRIDYKGAPIEGGQNLAPLVEPVILHPGMNVAPTLPVDARFLSPGLEVVPAHAQTSIDQPTQGAFELYLTFSTHTSTGPEPLVTTGKTGAGDFATVRYTDPTHAVFSIDHWGVYDGSSPAVQFDPAVPHRVTVSFGSFYPNPDDPIWADIPSDVKSRDLDTMWIALDGKVVLEAQAKAHPTRREQIHVGQNLIGGSGCGPTFTGQMHLVRRSGLQPAASGP